jgi:branched-chain amino acid transport system substrate-binding protein
VNTDEMTNAAAQYAKDKYAGVTAWNNLSYDYVTGHDYWTNFQSEMKKRNSSVSFNKSVFFPLTEQQVTPYITSLLSGVPQDKSQGLFLSTFGGGTIAVAKQGQAYDLFNKFKVVLNVGGGEDVSASIGSGGPPLTYIHDYYWTAYKNPVNDYLVKQFQSRPKQGPNTEGPHTWVFQGYTAIQVVAEGITKGKKADGTTLVKTLPGMHFKTAKGDMNFRKEDHLMIQPMAVFECQGATNPVGFTCPNVTSLAPNTFTPPPNPSTS